MKVAHLRSDIRLQGQVRGSIKGLEQTINSVRTTIEKYAPKACSPETKSYAELKGLYLGPESSVSNKLELIVIGIGYDCRIPNVPIDFTARIPILSYSSPYPSITNDFRIAPPIVEFQSFGSRVINIVTWQSARNAIREKISSYIEDINQKSEDYFGKFNPRLISSKYTRSKDSLIWEWNFDADVSGANIAELLGQFLSQPDVAQENRTNP